MDKKQAELLLQKVNASILMLTEIKKDLENFIGEDFLKERAEKDSYVVEETWIGDNGKEFKKATPYIKTGSWYCCGKPLDVLSENGNNFFHCSVCGSKYRYSGSR